MKRNQVSFDSELQRLSDDTKQHITRHSRALAQYPVRSHMYDQECEERRDLCTIHRFVDSQIIGQIDTIRRPQSRSKGFQKIIRNSFKEIVESISENKAQRIYLTFKTSKLRWSAIE
ncbi:Hypothetical protein NTJ_16033 [Nesidiocoris tenuis]|uniref:Uncharacterized protein n=1 Tax=Nesidiocoris tenuis TaxID=355587 RepID=A0ABN7BI73_9HEMI|nr:Hypothetical protein NTJ_16033 [Nesidiocoris tenuis]